MRVATKVALLTMFASGASLLVLGVVIWTGHDEQLNGVHIVIGIVFVLSLCAIAAIAARSGVPGRTVTLAAAWAGLVVLLGLTQEVLVEGDAHWAIQVLHVAVSMGAIWWGRRLVKLMAQARAAAAPTGADRPLVGSAPR